MVLQKFYQYSEGIFPTCVATLDDLEAHRTVELDPNYFQSYPGTDNVTQRLAPPGFFVAPIAGSSAFRALPRTRLTADITTASTSFTIKANTSRLLVAGDVLTAALPYASATFANTWANGDTVTVTIDGQAVTYTVANYSTLPALAAAAAAAFNADPKFSRKARFYVAAGGAVVGIQSFDGKAYSIGTSVTVAGNGTFALTGSVTALASGVAVGTVSAIDTTTDTVTLTSTASTALASGVAIGAVGYAPYDLNGSRLGLASPSQPVDLQWEPNTNYGLFTEGTFYRDRLPHWDGELAALYPEINVI